MNIVYKEFKIYEYKLKKYGIYNFSDGVNVFRNDPKLSTSNQNKVGKSSILKSMMHCMGLTVKNWDPLFCYKDIIFELTFKVDNTMMKIIRVKDHFSINDDNLMNLSEFKLEMAKVLNFELLLEHKYSTKKIVPYPEDYLMYFYVDQDASWGNKLFLPVNTSIGKYKPNAYKHIFNYLVGIDDNKVVHLKNEVEELNEIIKGINISLDMINYTESIIIDSDFIDGPSMNSDEFNFNIERFESIFHEIFTSEKELKRRLYKNSSKINKFIQEQEELELVFSDLNNIESSIKKSKCKVCSSELTSEILIRKYKIDNDKMEVAELHNRLAKKIQKCHVERKQLNSDLYSVREKLLQVQSELDKDISIKNFNDLVKIRVEREKTADFERIKDQRKTKLVINEKAKKLKNKEYNKAKKLLEERKKLVHSSYEANLSSIDLLTKSNIHLDDYTKLLNFGIKDTGTSKNIIILALFMAYFKLLEEYSMFKFPIILDTIIKDDHDYENLSAMSSIINNFYFKLKNQVFYSYVENDRFKLNNSNINYINIKNRICNKEFTSEENHFVNYLSEQLLEKSKSDED